MIEDDIDLTEFLTKDSFSDKIEQLVFAEQITYFEAIVQFAEEVDKSPEELVKFMSQVLLDKVKQSARTSGLITIREQTLESLM